MAKKRIGAIWQAGIADFAARRERAEALRAAVAHEAAASPERHVPDRAMEEQVRRAVIAATTPLRQEVAALRQELDGLRARVGRLEKGS